jgi:hypothetical protein
MVKKHMKKRLMKLSRRRKTYRKRRQQKGAGYSEDLKVMLYHGGPEHRPYPGPGYDCAGVPMRAGYITNEAAAIPGRGGLPGFSGGSRKQQKCWTGGRGGMGGADLGSAHGPLTTSATNTLLQTNPAPVMGGSRGKKSRRGRKQQGGRWGAFPELAPLSPNAVGMSGYSPILRQPCEIGTRNALNPDPNGVQSLSTYVSSKGIAGWTQTAGGKRRRTRRGKGSRRRKQQGGMSAAALAAAPIGVTVGDVDAMRYYAPTAGYSNAPLAPPVANNPGILMQLGYPARHFNEACMNTK